MTAKIIKRFNLRINSSTKNIKMEIVVGVHFALTGGGGRSMK